MSLRSLDQSRGPTLERKCLVLPCDRALSMHLASPTCATISGNPRCARNTTNWELEAHLGSLITVGGCDYELAAIWLDFVAHTGASMVSKPICMHCGVFLRAGIARCETAGSCARSLRLEYGQIQAKKLKLRFLAGTCRCESDSRNPTTLVGEQAPFFYGSVFKLK